MSAMFRSFSIFNYRVWFIGALVSNVGAWMQSTAQNLVVLTRLTDTDIPLDTGDFRLMSRRALDALRSMP